MASHGKVGRGLDFFENSRNQTLGNPDGGLKTVKNLPANVKSYEKGDKLKYLLAD